MSHAKHTPDLSERADIIRMALAAYAARTLGREKTLAEELTITAPASFDDAPELLEALTRLLAQCERLRLPGQSASDAEKNAASVIAKATGVKP